MSASGGWRKRNITEIVATLGSDSDKGLSKSKVLANRRRWGKNDLWYSGSPFMFLSAESGFSMLGYVIMAITAFSASAFDRCKDSVFVGISLLCGITISLACYIIAGVICKKHSDKWIPFCTVIRNGVQMKIKADALVLGDIVVLGKGDRVYADIKLTASEDVAVREPAFTKKKGTVRKAAMGTAIAAAGQAMPEDFIFAGSEVLSGSCRGVVCAVGDTTYQGRFGKIKLTQNKDTAKLSSLRKRGVSVGAIALMFSFVAVIAGVFIPYAAADFIGLFIIFLAFAVSAGGELVPALCCLAYYITMKNNESAGFCIRDAAGVDYLNGCDGICVENSSLMKSDRTELKYVWASGASVDVGDGGADELFSLMLAGTSYGEGKYGSEALLAVNAHTSERGDADKFIASTMNTKPVLDHKIVGATHYSLFVSANEQYFAVTGSIEEVISKCTKLRVNGTDRPISRDDISGILSSASDALKVASSIIAVAVRVSPYNNIKRLSVLTSDLSFIGFIAMETPAHRSLPAGLAYLRQNKTAFVLCTDGSGEDLNFARKLGVSKGRDDLVAEVSDKAMVELLSENKNGGALYIPSEEYVSDFLTTVKMAGKKLVYVGTDKYVKDAGFAVVSGEAVPCSGAYTKAKKGAEVSSVIDSYVISRTISNRLGKVYLYLLISAVLRGIYCITAVFGLPYVYPSLILVWGLMFDAAVSAVILAFKRKK